MFSLNLIHFGFLAGGLAVALPIVIHLLFRQKTRTVPIGSVRFLHQVVREHRRRRRVRQWLLLALRMLAVLLLALLFARPYRDQSLLRGLEQEIVVLIDRSASMQAHDAASETVFERAVAKARAELKSIDANAIVHVALCDAAGIKEVPVEDLPKAAATEAATDYALALGWAGDVLAASARSMRRIVLITDLQRSGLSRAHTARVPEGVELEIQDVGQPMARNLAVESAEASRVEIRPDSPLALRVVLRNHGALAARKVPVQCELAGPDGPIKVSKQADVAGRASTVVDLPLDVKTDGLYKGQVRVQFDDVLAVDNGRWVAFEARHPDRVLLVDGQEGRSIFTSETYFLETALRLRTEESDGRMRSFEPERIVWESGEGFPRLDGYRAIVLANVRRLSEQDGERLEAYLRGGGSLLIFAGDQVSRESFAPLTKRDLLPGKMATEPVAGKWRINQWEGTHPALACFSDPQHGDLRRMAFDRILPLEELAAGAHVLLQAGDHIVSAERTIGKGRCLYFASTADRDWTDLPRTRMYVPLVRQLLAYLTDQLIERAAVTNRLVARPDDKAGIRETAPGEGRWVVTNLDPRESALDRVTPEAFQEALGMTASKSSDAGDSATLGLTIPPDALRPDEIWTIVAWILLIVLAAETLLASRVHA